MKAVCVAALTLLGLVCWQRAVAQASSPAAPAPKKPELLATSKDAQPSPAGQGGAPVVRPAASSAGKTVAERQAETLEAMRKGQLIPAGHGSLGAGP